MPFTLSHPAAVLPLHRLWPRHLNFAALVIGSMTPDLNYFVPFFDFATLAHTIAGSFTVCLPSGVLLLTAFYFVRARVCFLLPRPHRGALAPLCAKRPALGPRDIMVILLSLLLGAWTHIFWDSFTHRHGWFVQHLAVLQQPFFTIGSTPFMGYYVLQQFSTVVGGIVLLFFYRGWLLRHSNSDAIASSDGWRYCLLGSIAFVAGALALFCACQAASYFSGFVAFRVFLFRGAVTAVSVAASLILVAAFVIRSCCSWPSLTQE
jgi:hypothetical protein